MRTELEAPDAHGNPSSVTHPFGRKARARVEAARAQVAALIGAEPAEIVFTSGATESNNLAILGVARGNVDRGRHIVTSRIEHKAALDPCRRLEKEGFSVTFLTPDTSGRISPESVAAALRADTQLVSLMHVNNEIGVIQDIATIGALCKERGIAFHTDAAQSAGKVPIDVRQLPVDFLSFTAHKIYGPKGIGALYVRRSARHLLRPLMYGGGQENGLRPGTLPTHQIVAFGEACRLASELRADEAKRLLGLREQLWAGLQPLGEVHLNGEGADRVPGILNVSFEGVEGESLVTALSDLAVSTGSACNSASGEPSYVLRALGRKEHLAESSLRFSFGRFTTVEDIKAAVDVVCEQVDRLRRISPRQPMPNGLPLKREREPQLEADDRLSPLVRHYFETLPGTEPVQGWEEGQILRGEAGSEVQGTWIRFHLLVHVDTVKDARFQAYGCPHTLAVAAWITTRLLGRNLRDAIPGKPAEWAQTLEVPAEKLGRLLIVEDALTASLQCRASGP